MAESFIGGVNRHFVLWSGWLFTVGGAIASLIIGKEYWWIGGLVVGVGLLALMTYAYQKHQLAIGADERRKREVAAAEAKLRQELSRIKAEHDTAVLDASKRLDEAQQLQRDAERKLNEVPLAILLQIESAIRQHAFTELANMIGRYVRYVERMQSVVATQSKPINEKSFVKRGDVLYALVSLPAAVCELLADDDAFAIDYKDANGLVASSGKLSVHQVESTKELVWFEVLPTSDELIRLSALAEKQVVPGKGYSVRPVCDLSRYSKLNLAGTADVFRTVVEEISSERH